MELKLESKELWELFATLQQELKQQRDRQELTKREKLVLSEQLHVITSRNRELEHQLSTMQDLCRDIDLQKITCEESKKESALVKLESLHLQSRFQLLQQEHEALLAKLSAEVIQGRRWELKSNQIEKQLSKTTTRITKLQKLADKCTCTKRKRKVANEISKQQQECQ